MSTEDLQAAASHRRSRDLTPIFEPRSVAVVGATEDPAKWGHWLTRRTLAGAHRRSVYLLSRSGKEIVGRPSYRSFAELPEAPELAVLAVPASAFEATVDDALARGTRAFVGISAGFAETGPEGAARQQALVERIRAHGGLFVGPNCVGVVDTAAELEAAWVQAGTEGLPPGAIGLVSQSGNVAFDAGIHARELGLGFSRFAALGNQADVTVSEVVDSLVDHAPTRLIAIYAEDFKDGRGLAEAAARATAAGKPVVLVAAGGDDAVQRATRSHTGSLATGDLVVDALCRATGMVRVHTPTEMMELANVLLSTAPARGRRVAVVGDAGGHGVMATGLLSRSGLDVPATSPALELRLREALGPAAAVGNPIDSGASGLDPYLNVEAVRRVAESGEVDAILLVGNFGGWVGYDDALAEREAEAGREIAAACAAHGITLVVHTLYPRTAPTLALRDAGAPIFRTLESAVRALDRASAEERAVAAAVPALPAPATPPLTAGDYFAARAVLAEEAGIRFPPATSVARAEEAVAAAADLGWPVALKNVGLLHKSDAGGVALGLADEAALRAAFERMREATGPGPFSVERMVDTAGGTELLVGARSDPRLGPVVTVGMGGVLAEILEDVAVALAPVDEDQARRLVERLRGAALLRGARGRPPADVDAVAAVVAGLSRFAARRPEIAEVEVNPLLATPAGAVALDARLILETPS